jgi:hypothetical protein
MDESPKQQLFAALVVCIIIFTGAAIMSLFNLEGLGMFIVAAISFIIGLVAFFRICKIPKKDIIFPLKFLLIILIIVLVGGFYLVKINKFFNEEYDFFNIQTSGIVKTTYGNNVECQGDFSFSIDTNNKTFYIKHNNSNTQTCFGYSGMYKIKTVKEVQDSYMGKGYSFLLLKDNIEYVVTITSQLISFSRLNHTDSECWSFVIVD